VGIPNRILSVMKASNYLVLSTSSCYVVYFLVTCLKHNTTTTTTKDTERVRLSQFTPRVLGGGFVINPLFMTMYVLIISFQKKFMGRHLVILYFLSQIECRSVCNSASVHCMYCTNLWHILTSIPRASDDNHRRERKKERKKLEMLSAEGKWTRS